MAEEEHMDVENPVEKRNSKKNPSILDSFEKLSHKQPHIRIKNGVTLLRQLSTGDGKKEKEVSYALGRLIRGLGSAKNQTKTGYFATLVALFDVGKPNLETIFTAIDKELHRAGNNSKSENADISSGQVLVCGAILRSTLYQSLNNEDKKKVINLLLTAGRERDYLVLASYIFIIDLYGKIDSTEFEQVIFHEIKEAAFKPWNEHNLDSFYLMVETLKSFRQSINQKFLKNVLGGVEVLTKHTVQHICTILMNIHRISNLDHPIFKWTIDALSQSDLKAAFFTKLDQSLLKYARNKYFVYTKLLTGTLANLDDVTLLPTLLTENYLQQTLQSFKTSVGKNRDPEFHRNAYKLFEVILHKLKDESVSSDVKLEVIRRLIFFPGTFIFEKITKSKLVQNITQLLDAEGVQSLAEIYKEVILAKNTKVVFRRNVEDKWWISDRIYASYLLVKLVNHKAVNENTEWRLNQLTFLMENSLCQESDSDPVGTKLASSLKETFFSALTLKSIKLKELNRILYILNKQLYKSIEKLRNPLSDESKRLFKRSLDFVTSMQTTKTKKKLVFSILFLHMNLQLFNDPELAADSLKDLFSCYEHTESVDGETNDPKWIHVVIDLFLHLLSRNSNLLRNVIANVFPDLCEYVDSVAMCQMLDVLDPDNDENPLERLKIESSEDEDEDEAEEEDEEDSEEEDDISEQEEDTTNDKLRLALQQALGPAVESDQESIDLDEMSDNEGDRIDQALGKAFKQFKPNLGRSKKQKKDDEILTHFRVRVLDLIEIYLGSETSMLATLEIMLPLLKTLEFSIRDEHQKPLRDRVERCLKKLTGLKKFKDVDDVFQTTLIELLESLLDKGTKNTIIIHDMADRIAECCVFVINCSQLVTVRKKKVKKGVIDVIKRALETYFGQRDCSIPYVLFKNVMQLNWQGVIDLIPTLSTYVFDENIRQYRKHQALELLKLFFKNQRLLQNAREYAEQVAQPAIHEFLDSSAAFFQNFSSAPEKKKLVREKFLIGLFELLADCKKSKSVDDYREWSTLAEKIRLARSHILLAGAAKHSFNRLCGLLNVSQIVEMQAVLVRLDKLPDDEREHEEETPKKKKFKPKRNQSNDKLKKESKQLRLEGLSHGFGGKRTSDWSTIEGAGKRSKMNGLDGD